jgi:predicted negative regulator of RcsB-dependent stress response
MIMASHNTNSVLKNISDVMYANNKNVMRVFALVALLVVIFFVHKFWVINREQSAQYDFAALMTEFETVSRDKDPQWSALLEKFETQYKNHSNSSLLPYYLGYKVQILLAQDKKDEALLTLDTMIKDMPGSPIIALYEMERALIQLDVVDAKLNEVGLETLKALAQNKDNIYRDSAQYYLGRYCWAHNQIADARAIWQQLVDEQRDEKMSPSPWVQEVQQQLALTIV